MQRDSEDQWIEWHRPTSTGDAFRQLSSNVFCGCLLCVGCTGELLWRHVIQKMRTCCGHRNPRHLNQAPIPLPTQKRRALTPLLPADTTGSLDIKPRTLKQADSTFLTKLPLEVRIMVYHHIINGSDGKVVHIFKRMTVPAKMGHWRCTKAIGGQPCGWGNPCSMALPFNGLTYDEYRLTGDPTHQRIYSRSRAERKQTLGGYLAMMRTCRQIYAETVSLLYSTVHFHFPHPADIAHFSNTILPHRFNTVQCLSVDWEDARFGSNRGWDKAWDVIGKMTNLKEVRIFVKDLFITLDSPKLHGMLDSIKKIRVAGTVEVVIPADQMHLWRIFIPSQFPARFVSAAVTEIVLPTRPQDPFDLSDIFQQPTS